MGRGAVLALVALLTAILAGCATAGTPGPGPPSPPTFSSTPAPTVRPAPTPAARPTVSPTPAGEPVALVPVVAFWSPLPGLTRDELATALAGRDPRFPSVAVPAPDVAALAALLGVTPAAATTTGDAETVRDAVRAEPDALGILRAEDVTPDLRALAIDRVSLFGNGRLRSLADWPLLLRGERAPGSAAFDPARTWTLVAGGDVMLDREVYRQAVLLDRGADYPWDGGRAEIARRVCCSGIGAPLPEANRTGGEGTLRALFRDADLAIVNLEGPAPDRFGYHPTGLVFTFDPALLAGLANAGVDAVSLANNHVRDARAAGVTQTIGHLDALGIAHAGAGKDLAAARVPAWFEANGTRVAVLAYDGIRPEYNATATAAGSADLRRAYYAADIAAARDAGADVVVVFVHWGAEYTSAPTGTQRRQAADFVAAGADLVLGSHSHWAGALEEIDGRPVFHSLGDLIFDLPRSEETLEGMVVELTYSGGRLVQVGLRPTVIVDRVQPNLLDPAGDGAVILDRMREASRGLLDW